MGDGEDEGEKKKWVEEVGEEQRELLLLQERQKRKVGQIARSSLDRTGAFNSRQAKRKAGAVKQRGCKSWAMLGSSVFYCRRWVQERERERARWWDCCCC